MLQTLINNQALINLDELANIAKDYINDSRADNTKKAYQSDWDHFVAWCKTAQLNYKPADPKTVAIYIIWLAEQGFKTSTIERRLSSISQAHITSKLYSPINSVEVKKAWEGIKRRLGMAKKHKKAAEVDDIKLMINTLGEKKLDIRDKALLLITFSGAFRRSEVVSLNVEDIDFTKDGLFIRCGKSKTNQEGEDDFKGIHYNSIQKYCPVLAYKEWLDVSGIESGAIFRPIDRHGNIKENKMSDHAVALIVKKCAEKAGLDPTEFAAHSLRSGLATTAAMKGLDENDIMRQTGHKSVTVLRKYYIQPGSVFRNNVTAKIWD